MVWYGWYDWMASVEFGDTLETHKLISPSRNSSKVQSWNINFSMSILRARCVNMHKSQWRCSKNGTMAQSISDTMGCFIWQELSHLRQSGHQTIDPWLQQLTQHMAKDPQHLNCMSKLLGLSISSPVDTFSWCMLADIGFPRIFPWVFQGFSIIFPWGFPDSP